MKCSCALAELLESFCKIIMRDNSGIPYTPYTFRVRIRVRIRLGLGLGIRVRD